MEERFSRMNRNVPVVLWKVSQPGVQWDLDQYRKIDGVNPKILKVDHGFGLVIHAELSHIARVLTCFDHPNLGTKNSCLQGAFSHPCSAQADLPWTEEVPLAPHHFA